MSTSLALEIAAVILAFLGVVRATALVLASARAERDWARATHRISIQQDRVAALLEEHGLGRTDAVIGHAELSAALRDLVLELREEHEIPAKSARVIESALLQPSEVGRRAYAEKLAREALEDRKLATA